MPHSQTFTSRSAGPSVATMLSFLSCMAGATTLLVSISGSRAIHTIPVPLLAFLSFPWLLGAALTFVPRQPAWQVTWLVCVSLLAIGNIAVTAITTLSQDLVLRMAIGGLPLLNIFALPSGFFVSWLIALTMEDPAATAASQDVGVTSPARTTSAAAHDDSAGARESRADPARNEP